ncbi:unnamed protein product [Alternaria burnsii]|nr:unnamed protein product [Alternaria burnsii]
MMSSLQQLAAAAAEAHSSFNSIPNTTDNRASTFDTIPGNHTEKEREAAATMLILNKLVVYPKEDKEAACILLAMNEPGLSPGSDSQRTITDSERTISVTPTPVSIPPRSVTSPTPTPVATQVCEIADVLPDATAVSASSPPVKKISLKEYTAMKKSRRDLGA